MILNIAMSMQVQAKRKQRIVRQRAAQHVERRGVVGRQRQDNALHKRASLGD